MYTNPDTIHLQVDDPLHVEFYFQLYFARYFLKTLTLSSHAKHSASRRHFSLWRTIPLGQKQPSFNVELQIDRSLAIFVGSLSAVDDFIIFSFSSTVLQVSAQPQEL